jgi:Fibrinogen beta and gamma chains, C-terminal globular domain
VDDESTGFMLLISGFSGNTYNSLTYTGAATDPGNLNGMRFSTIDRDNDMLSSFNCAAHYSAGFWYNQCSYVHINSDGAGFIWMASFGGILQTSRVVLIPSY